jgi:mercuric ion transport protein
MPVIVRSRPRVSTGEAGTAQALTLAALAATLASACCVVPLLLAIIGISGAWISRLRGLEPYSPWLTGVACAALGAAAWRVYRPARFGSAACDVGGVACASLGASTRRWFWAVAVLTLVPVVVPLIAPVFY